VAMLAVLGLLFGPIRGWVVEDGFAQCFWVGNVPGGCEGEEAGSAARVVGDCAVGVCDGEVDVSIEIVSMTVGAVRCVDGDAFNVTLL